MTAAGSSVYALGGQSTIDGLTLTRVRGLFVARVSSVAAVTDRMYGAVGIAQFTENAWGAGIGSMETPWSDADWDGWLWHSFFDVGTEAGGAGGTIQIPIDSKAMRRSPEGEVIGAVLQVALETGTVQLETSCLYRILDLLP